MPLAFASDGQRIRAMQESMTSTTFAIEGYRTVKTLGMVRGITVRSRSIIGNFAGAIQTVFGGKISIYTQLCEKAREEAFQQMLQHAEAIGGNAVIGVRYDANEVMNGVTEVLCYGTAAVVEAGPPPLR